MVPIAGARSIATDNERSHGVENSLRIYYGSWDHFEHRRDGDHLADLISLGSQGLHAAPRRPGVGPFSGEGRVHPLHSSGYGETGSGARLCSGVQSRELLRYAGDPLEGSAAVPFLCDSWAVFHSVHGLALAPGRSYTGGAR